ncbi:hypothetical protein J3Q64DRAFT_1731675 [Phycomyces blakesleeanus]|uniref:CUE domain-containing protein n=1 Tax=Phycomyces blakesleeanus TaxID=4837 RepID=A0ABR3B3H3_PHYBL
MSEANDIHQPHLTETQATQSPTTSQQSPESQEQDDSSPVAPSAPPIQQEPPAQLQTLKEAFPSVEVDVIEAILESQGGQLEAAFEALLAISDPNYRPEPTNNIPPQPAPAPHPAPHPPVQQTQPSEYYQPQREIPAQHENLQSNNNTNERIPPPKPPRPQQQRPNNFTQQSSGLQNQPYGYWAGTQDPSIQTRSQISVEEQLRMDEEFARQLAMEDANESDYQYQRQHQRQGYQRQRQQRVDDDSDDDDPLFNFQEEFPVIKEKVIEVGNAAKKKVIDLFNQFKASRNNMSSSGSSIPTTNVHYRGLPSDDGDDLLAGDMSALHLSDNDVYAQTRGVVRPRTTPENQTYIEEDQEDQEDQGELRSNIIHVNRPFVPPVKTQKYNDAWSTEEQLRSDEALARRLANEDMIERGSLGTNTSVTGIRAPSPSQSTTPTKASEDPVSNPEKEIPESSPIKEQDNKSENKAKEEEDVPYVIGDDDSDDDLVDEDEDTAVKEHPRNKYEQKPHSKTE